MKNRLPEYLHTAVDEVVTAAHIEQKAMRLPIAEAAKYMRERRAAEDALRVAILRFANEPSED